MDPALGITLGVAFMIATARLQARVHLALLETIETRQSPELMAKHELKVKRLAARYRWMLAATWVAMMLLWRGIGHF